MPNRRTVDPTGQQPSSKMVSFRIDPSQEVEMDLLCKAYDCSRSSLFRRLLRQAVQQVQEGKV